MPAKKSTKSPKFVFNPDQRKACENGMVTAIGKVVSHDRDCQVRLRAVFRSSIPGFVLTLRRNDEFGVWKLSVESRDKAGKEAYFGIVGDRRVFREPGKVRDALCELGIIGDPKPIQDWETDGGKPEVP